MTFRSRRIYRYPSGRDRDLEQIAHDLAQETGGPHIGNVSVFRWATDRGLPIVFIDNCWIRVTVTRDQALAFLTDNADPIQEPPAEGWEEGFTCDRYVIEEEEF